MEETIRLTWISDAHFEHLEAEQITQFLEEVAKLETDAVLLGGDTTLAENLNRHLRQIETAINLPIYFVLGNHDYYGGSIEEVRSSAQEIDE